MVNHLVPRPEYFKRLRSIPWLSMPWLLPLPGQSHPWHWLSYVGSHFPFQGTRSLYTKLHTMLHHWTSQNLKAVKYGFTIKNWFRIVQSLWNLTGASAALLPRRLSDFRMIQSFQHSISPLRDFARYHDKTPNGLVNGVPVMIKKYIPVSIFPQNHLAQKRVKNSWPRDM